MSQNQTHYNQRVKEDDLGIVSRDVSLLQGIKPINNNEGYWTLTD